jgi:hypothetical protein
MARRRGLLKFLGPTSAANVVIERFVNEARIKLSEWSRNYTAGIQSYLADVQRQNEAKAKLASWYNALLQVVGQIATAFAQAKQIYASQRAGVTVPAPQVPQPVPAR